MSIRLLSLVFAPFAFGTSAFVFIGLINPMAEDLNIPVPLVGQLQTAFALACGIGGPILARLLSGIDRKKLLVSIMLILVAMNVASALAPQFGFIAVTRLAGGFFAALTLPLASTIAVNLASDVKRADAIATVMAGYTLAFLVGMPVGSVLGDTFGWRAAFWFAAAIALGAALIISLLTPGNVSAPKVAGMNFRSALVGDNPKIMAVSLLAFIATFATVSFIGPVITKSTGVEGAAIGGIQIATGIGSLLGLPIGAALARLPIRRALTILLSVTFGTQLLFTFGMINDYGPASIPALVVTMSLASAALFATSPIIQSRLTLTAGPATTIALALNGSMIYFGQGLGSSIGGSVIASAGIGWTGAAGAVMAIAALVLISRIHNS